MLAAIGQLAANFRWAPSLITSPFKIQAQTKGNAGGRPVNALTVQWSLTGTLHEDAEFGAIYASRAASFDDLDPVSKLRFGRFWLPKTFGGCIFALNDGILTASLWDPSTLT